MNNYKLAQAKIREKLKPKLIYAGNTLDLGIKEAKRTMSQSDATAYKREAWKRLRIATSKK